MAGCSCGYCALSEPAPDAVFVIGAPRSGSTLLFSVLSASAALWSLYQESEAVFRRLRLDESGDRGHRLGPSDLDARQRERLVTGLAGGSMNYQRLWPRFSSALITHPRREKLLRLTVGAASRLLRPRPFRIVEKNPKNCLRVDLLDALFPGARFVHLVRDPRSNIGSLIDGWRSGRYRSREQGVQLDGYVGGHWCFLRPPGWRERRRGGSLAGVCAWQYAEANRLALEQFDALAGSDRVLRVRYEDLVASPRRTVSSLFAALNVPICPAVDRLLEKLPRVNAVSAPAADKWRRHDEAIRSVLPTTVEVVRRLGYEEALL
jgi:hypothetical protein